MVNELEVNSTEAVDVEVEMAAQTQRERDEELKEMSKDSKDALMVSSDMAVTEAADVEAVVGVAMAERRRDDDPERTADVSNRERLAACCGVAAKQVTADQVAVCSDIVEREANVARPLLVIAVEWFVVSLFSILRKDRITGVVDCSAVYWVITFLSIPLMLGVRCLIFES